MSTIWIKSLLGLKFLFGGKNQRKFRSALGDRLLPNVAKNGTSLSADFPKFSGDFRWSVGDSVLVEKR